MRFQRFWPLLFLLALARVAAPQDSARVELVGVGTNAPLSIYSKWFQAIERSHPNLHISYLPSGSETGIQMVTSGAADFGATDAPMTDKQRAGAKVSQFATVLVAIMPVYNVPDVVAPLKFSPQALAGIYLGKIAKWNDPAISAANPGVRLPSSNIAVIHSTSGRGCTYIWSDYLGKVSVEWKTKVGRGISIDWPVGKEAVGNGNLSRSVRETANSIGYVELAYAVQNNLPHGQVQNATGKFISANASSMAAAGAAAIKTMGQDSRASITNPSGDESYPICSFTWILVSETMNSKTKREAVKDLLRWALNEGQTYAPSTGFAQLPRAIAERELKAIDAIP